MGQIAAVTDWAGDRLGGPVQVEAARRVPTVVALLAAALDRCAGLDQLDDCTHAGLAANSRDVQSYCWDVDRWAARHVCRFQAAPRRPQSAVPCCILQVQKDRILRRRKPTLLLLVAIALLLPVGVTCLLIGFLCDTERTWDIGTVAALPRRFVSGYNTILAREVLWLLLATTLLANLGMPRHPPSP